MSYMPEDLDRLLAEAVGESPMILDALRADFLASATAHVMTMATVETSDQWRDAAHRLQGLAASFGLTELMGLAAAAARAAPNSAALDPIRRALAELG